MNRGARSGQDWPATLLCVLAPLAVSLLAVVVFRATNDEFELGLALAGGGNAPGALDPEAAGYWELLARERRARLLWGSSILGLVAVSVAAIAVSLWSIAQSSGGRDRKLLLLGLAVLTGVMVGFIWFNDVSLEYTRRAILEPTVGRALSLTGSGFTLDLFALSRRLTNSISTAATIALVIAIVATTQVNRPPASLSFEQRARSLAGQVRRLHLLLYASAAVLVSIILSMGAWLLWPLALAATPGAEAILADVASGVGFYWGTSFTLVLAAAYLPSALCLNHRIRDLQDLAEDPESFPAIEGRRGIFARLGLDVSIFAQAARLIAILSPMITGTLPFLDSIT